MAFKWDVAGVAEGEPNLHVLSGQLILRLSESILSDRTKQDELIFSGLAIVKVIRRQVTFLAFSVIHTAALAR